MMQLENSVSSEDTRSLAINSNVDGLLSRPQNSDLVGQSNTQNSALMGHTHTLIGKSIPKSTYSFAQILFLIVSDTIAPRGRVCCNVFDILILQVLSVQTDMTIYCQKITKATDDLIKYMDIIRNMARQKGNWLLYDLEFRKSNLFRIFFES
jgi:hypothetical protein